MECSFSLYRMKVMAQKLLSSSFTGDGEATQSSGFRTCEIPDEKKIQIGGFRENFQNMVSLKAHFSIHPFSHTQAQPTDGASPPSISFPPGTSECDFIREIGTNKHFAWSSLGIQWTLRTMKTTLLEEMTHRYVEGKDQWRA